MLLSSASLSGQSAPRTMQFHGSICGQTVLVLVDSGSSHSFLNSALASHISGVQQLPIPIQVKVADGNVIHCSAMVPHAEWSLQGHLFH